MEINSFVIGYKKGKAAGGSSGGGGSLPAGVYFTPSPIKAATNYRHKRFMFNGELYAGCGSVAGDGYLLTIKKWDGSNWVDVVSVASSTHYLDADDFKVAEINGKAHIFSGKRHSIFDGTTITKSTDLDQTTAVPVVWQDDLYVLVSGSGRLCKWDEQSESWTDILSTSKMGELYVINNQLYARGYDLGYYIYQFENGEFVKKSTATVCTGNLLFIKGNKKYCQYSGALYCYDFDTHTETVVSVFPTASLYLATQNANDPSLIMATNTSNAYHPCFDVTIIEATE